MKHTVGFGLLLVTVLGIASLVSGWVEVAPGEVMVVRRLGRVLTAPWTPGPHLGLPFGLDQRTRVRTDLVRRLEVGLAGSPTADEEPGAGEYLTGDLNLLRARAVVQYRVADPSAFVLRTADPEPLIARLAESSLARAVARRGIDAALRLERAAIAGDVEAALTRSVRDQQLGIAVLGVSLTDARPPSEVAADFAAAQAAQSEHDRRINEARTFAVTTRTATGAEARARLDRARARADRAIVLARSGAARFLALLAEADRARPLTVRRLYAEMLKELLPRIRRKLVLTPDEPVDLSILGVP